MCERKQVEDILIILKSLAINYPVLRGWGLDLSKLLVLVVDEGQMRNAIDLLSEIDVPKLNERMNYKEVGELILNTNSSFVIYPYSSSRKGEEFFSFLSSIGKIGEISGQKINAVPLVVVEGVPIINDKEEFFSIYLNGDLSGVYVANEHVVPPDDKLAVVEDKISAFIGAGSSPDEKALLAATCFLYPSMAASGLENEFEALLELAKKLIAFDDENRVTNDLEDVFINELYRWQERTRFNEVYELPYLEMEVLEKIGSVIIYEKDYVYIKESLLREIMEPLLKIFSYLVLKDALVKLDILCAESNRTYTAKMGYYNVAGVYQRERMLKFRRERLWRVGELDFVEVCLEEAGGI